MSSVSKYVSPTESTPQTNGICLHRNTELPSSAIRAGASSMPAAWRTDHSRAKTAFKPRTDQVRSFADIAMDPFRWMTASKTNKITSALVLGSVVLLLLF
ncbi:hypothetical protein Q4555_12165 [Octadecabacter sp. 1_MG-2023]|uniref:hypothetical protein n=1 Tax=unclassified Octadecabacter TaxID=196158 RepID=UPI001C0A2573|nr:MULTISPECIES: hypothetical protein [unclassified Octadecabacter]MBU2993730.1 hypothetical protein [Octadecabacter sp. B2R22]MDO6735426.1 hypothetical protein [Octadecabacter sp. 1_MG-2023]